jgi:hypothetical protein
MWNSQLQQHLDQFHENDNDDSSINRIKESNEDSKQQPITTVASRRQDESSSSQQDKRENEKTFSSTKSKNTIPDHHPFQATNKTIKMPGFFDHFNEWSSAGLFMVYCMGMATFVVLVALTRYLSETTGTAANAATAAPNGTCNSYSRNIILTWLGVLSILLCTFLAGWYGRRIRNGCCQQSSHHEEQKSSVQTLDFVVYNHPALVREESWSDKVIDHHRVVDDSSRHQQLRLRLVELLGTIGAPPLVLEQDEIHRKSNRELERGDDVSSKTTGNQTSITTM